MTGMQMAFMGGRGLGALSAFNSPSSTYNSLVGAGTITSDPVTCSASGGTAPYTYAWTYVSGTSFTINSPATATTTFSRATAGVGFFSGVYRCTVTDSASGVVVASPDVTIELERI